MARLKDIVVDARHPASIARFWAVALDGVDVAPYDEAELERLRGIGVYDTEDDPTVVVEGAGMAHRLLFQRVPEAKVAKNRLHLDLTAVDVVAEVGRHKADHPSLWTDHPSVSEDYPTQRSGPPIRSDGWSHQK
ncbi:MAG: VOC family protein [Actinomycetota bacterium]|nr:VOC family protein [Actinomycetota bacterium]